MANNMGLPILPPAGGGGGAGTNLFNLSASVTLDAESFSTGIANLKQAIDNIDQKMSDVINSINALVETTRGGIESSASSAQDIIAALQQSSGEVTSAIRESSSAAGNVEDAADDATAAVRRTGEAAEDVGEAAEGATEAADETEQAVERMGAAAQRGGLSFASFLQIAQDVWGTVSSVAGFVWDIGTDLVDSAVTVANEERRFSTIFKGVEDDANAALESISEKTGYHVGLLRGNFASIYTQLRAAGWDHAEAMKMSQEAMLLAADAAATYGISMDEATSRTLSFMRGNVEAGESIGLFTSAATRDQYAQEMYGADWKDLTEKERENIMLRIGTDIYSDAGLSGAAAEYAASFSVAMQNLQRVWLETKAILGTPIANAMVPVLERLQQWIEANPEKIEKLAEGIGKLVDAFADVFIAFVEDLDDEMINDIINIVLDFFEALAGLAQLLPPIVDFLLPIVQWLMENSTGPLWEGVGMIMDGDIIGGMWKIFGATNPGALSAQAGFDLLGTVGGWLGFGGDDDVAAVDGMDRGPSMMQTDGSFQNESAAAAEAAAAAKGDIDDHVRQALRDVAMYVKTGDISGDSPWWNLEPGDPDTDLVDRFGDFLVSIHEDSDTRNAVVEGLTPILEAIPGMITSGLSGVSVQMDGITVGHLVAPTVMGDMARSVRGSRYTGGGNNA